MARVGFSRAKTTRLQSAVKTETRDMTAASGDVAYSGYGFKPTCLIVFATLEGHADARSWGMADSTKAEDCIAFSAAGPGFSSNTHLLSIFYDATPLAQYADLKSFDADGYTLTWVKTGAAAGTANLKVLALR